jgi:predicted alpha/beta hydrolase family esterase
MNALKSRAYAFLAMSSPARLPVSRPSLTLLGAEPWRAALEFLSFTLAPPKPQSQAGTGDGHPVIIFPGLASDGSVVAPIRDYCESLGYQAIDWGRGYNAGPTGDLDQWFAELASHTAGLLQRYDKTATLIGWSLGGIYARELGKMLAPQVRQVITIATPFNADADHTNMGWFRLLSSTSAAIAPELSQRLRTPPPLPTTSIYSRSDGVVAWETCCHAADSRWVQDIEIDGSHTGMGWNPAALNIIADRLGQQPGSWLPYAKGI